MFTYPLFRGGEIDFEFTIANDRWSAVIIEANTILSAKNWPILYTWQPNKWWDGYDHCARKLCNLSLYEEEIDNKSRSCSMEHCCSLVTLPNRRWHTIEVIRKDYWKCRLQERKNDTRVAKYSYWKNSIHTMDKISRSELRRKRSQDKMVRTKLCRKFWVLAFWY